MHATTVNDWRREFYFGVGGIASAWILQDGSRVEVSK